MAQIGVYSAFGAVFLDLPWPIDRVGEDEKGTPLFQGEADLHGLLGILASEAVVAITVTQTRSWENASKARALLAPTART